MKINLCKHIPDSECETLDFILDDVAISMIETLSVQTGKTYEEIIEDCLVKMPSNLQGEKILTTKDKSLYPTPPVLRDDIFGAAASRLHNIY